MPIPTGIDIAERLTIRPERPDDTDAIHAVLTSAFGPVDPCVPRIVDDLRSNDRLTHALVASLGGVLVGFAAASRVWIKHVDAELLGIAPIAVVPAFQRQGIGTALMQQLLDVCRTSQAIAAVVLGDPAYYGRFGFRPADTLDLRCTFTDGAAFQAMPLIDGGLDGVQGLVEYDACFDA